MKAFIVALIGAATMTEAQQYAPYNLAAPMNYQAAPTPTWAQSRRPQLALQAC